MKKETYLTAVYQVILTVYFYVAMEWLFFVTKPSLFDLVSWGNKVLILFVSAGPILVLGFSCLIPLISLSYFLKKYLRKITFHPWVIGLPAAVFATLTTVLMGDNFTYTIFKSGIFRTKDHQPYVYLLGILLVFILWLRKFFRDFHPEKSVNPSVLIRHSVLILPLITLVALLVRLSTHNPPSSDFYPVPEQPIRQRPNIIFFAADGVEASHLHPFGYPRDTTPALTSIAAQSWVFENAFSNSAKTTGSLISMLTGKLPTSTAVFFPPHILAEQHAYQHLPGILKKIGYQTLQETVRYYADGPDLNMKYAFDMANRITYTHQIEQSNTFSWEKKFLAKLKTRVTDRFLHLVGREKMINRFALVNTDQPGKVYGFSDEDRINRAITFMDNAKDPFFIHFHLMSTHCCWYHPSVKLFSQNKPHQSKHHEVDFYDDAIYNSDRHFAKLLAYLKESGKYDNTLIVYSSDHSADWDVIRRVPLMIKFPQNRHVGRTLANVQLVDVAPTVLDSLGLPIPGWMDGHSLIGPDSSRPLQPIFSINRLHYNHFKTNQDRLGKLIDFGPPLYGLSVFSLIVCQNWYKLNVRSGTLTTGKIAQHTAFCKNELLPSDPQAKRMMISHLSSHGFRLSNKVRSP